MKIKWSVIFAVAILAFLTTVEPIGFIATLIILLFSLKGAYTYKEYSTFRRLASWIIILLIAILNIPVIPSLASIALLYLAYKGIAGGKK